LKLGYLRIGKKEGICIRKSGGRGCGNCKTTANGLTTIWLHDLLTITGLPPLRLLQLWSIVGQQQPVAGYIMKSEGGKGKEEVQHL